MLGKRTSKAVRLLRSHMEAAHSMSDESAKISIDGDWDRGLVFYQPSSGPVVELYDCPRHDTKLQVHKDANSARIGFDFADKLDEINAAA